ncbi:ABC-2 type transport system ATP-binding protein [Actinomadura pelletieri DSM 43383]|uniref:ABC-2 type transport system ATP-binding protein n=1 Tax=Actinomadura pelletieri DSM 43383 TaxID=1120940 RepID=A0A495QN51_9ACTN|nr:ATP-binding cassette domain-containing protein [Actinomadura pelletieri]RKS74272.1 ABC-2 type transport system ATP-binding protein [Actinomadura pelletieri DSM 43383]
MITLDGLTKRYGDRTAVDDLSVEISPGKVTGFLGPNGAGKSTTMRMIVGHDHPTAGRALVNGVPYAALRYPLREVGALLDAKALHPGRSARQHLRVMARSNGIPRRRVDEVIGMVGLDKVAARRAGTFSLGMSQRLGIAGALLGDPEVLIFDEPVNGLDLEGVRWVREMARSLAAEGRTVFISSHLLSEMQLTADHLVVIGEGRLIADEPMTTLVGAGVSAGVRIRSPEPGGLRALRHRFLDLGRTVEETAPDCLTVYGTTAEEAGDLAFDLGVRLHELRVEASTLEEAYLDLTAGRAEYTTARPPGGTGDEERTGP